MKNLSVAKVKELFNAKLQKLVEGFQIEEPSKGVIIEFISAFSYVKETSTSDDFFQQIDQVKAVVDCFTADQVTATLPAGQRDIFQGQKERIISGLEQIKAEIVRELCSHDAQMVPNDEEMISLLEKVIGGEEKTASGALIIDRAKMACNPSMKTSIKAYAVLVRMISEMRVSGQLSVVPAKREYVSGVFHARDDWGNETVEMLRRAKVPDILRSNEDLMELAFLQPNQGFQKAMINCVGLLPAVPYFMKCSITLKPFKYPVFIEGDEGAKHVFEKECIARVITENSTHPLTGLPLRADQRVMYEYEAMFSAINLYKTMLRTISPVYYKTSLYAQAVNAYKQFLEFEPECVRTMNNIMLSMLHQANYQGMIDFYQEEVLIADLPEVPPNLQAHFYAAQAYIAEPGSVFDAKESVEKALEVTQDPKYKDKKWRKTYQDLHSKLLMSTETLDVGMFAGVSEVESPAQDAENSLSSVCRRA